MFFCLTEVSFHRGGPVTSAPAQLLPTCSYPDPGSVDPDDPPSENRE